MDYSDEEYEELEGIINHSLDLKEPHFALHQIRKKYSLQNKVTGKEYESAQFVYMRMAMSLAEDQPSHRRLTDAKKWYKYFSQKKLNAPTPNYVNLGTPHKGFASCCVYKTGDNAKSLAIGDHIAYTMTYMSAGIGSFIQTRSLKDPVRGGSIVHQGKLPYFRSLEKAVSANTQNGRGGAATTYFSAYDPEVETIIPLKNPMSTEDKKIRGIDYAMQMNTFFAKKVARNEDIFLFNVKTAPDLTEAMFSGNAELFESLYNKYDSDKSFEKVYIKARDILINEINEGYETGRAYLAWVDEMNRHTPHKDAIYQSNLCLELSQPTQEYMDMLDLYSTEDHGRGEVSMCSLAGIISANIASQEEYEEVAYYALLMIDKCIHRSHYELPHVGVTAKARMNAGVGLIGTAHYLAKHHVEYGSDEAKRLVHELAEKHAYSVIKASLQLGKELGNAPWIDRTKWGEGWLPIDTYKKSVDNVVDGSLLLDWESLRSQIIDNGGIRNSSLINHMPSESSSKAAATTNGVYPIRQLAILKTDESNTIYWAAPDAEKLAKWYTSAWNVPTKDMVDTYAIIQKFSDQSISADEYRVLEDDETVGTDEIISNYLYMTKMGMKTRYYLNTKTSSSIHNENGVEIVEEDPEDCASCKL
jgi:ribonucleoside-diphosphate reductase alpha chain